MDNKGIDLRATLAQAGNSLVRACDPKVREALARNSLPRPFTAAERKSHNKRVAELKFEWAYTRADLAGTRAVAELLKKNKTTMRKAAMTGSCGYAVVRIAESTSRFARWLKTAKGWKTVRGEGVSSPIVGDRDKYQQCCSLYEVHANAMAEELQHHVPDVTVRWHSWLA